MSMNGVEYQKLAFIHVAETTPVLDDFGSVKGGYIRVSGSLCAANLTARYASPRALIHLKGIGLDLAMDGFYLDDDVSWNPEDSQPFTFYLLGLVSEVRPYSSSPTKGLLLQQCASQRGIYMRIGAFCARAFGDESGDLPSEEASSTDLDHLYQAFLKFKPPESKYLHRHRHGQFTIDII
jgi:hypothetical protein